MMGRLKATAPLEPMASAVPAEFWYVRAKSVGAVFRLANQVDAWGTPAVSIFDQEATELDLADRYETELGVARSALGKAVGDEVIASVALCGSDPYFREGTDMTALFLVKNAPLFRAALAGTLDSRGKGHGGLTQRTVSYGGVEITIATSPTGACGSTGRA